MRPRTDTQTHTHTQTRVTTIHFASSTTHAKCNDKMWTLETVKMTFTVTEGAA